MMGEEKGKEKEKEKEHAVVDGGSALLVQAIVTCPDCHAQQIHAHESPGQGWH